MATTGGTATALAAISVLSSLAALVPGGGVIKVLLVSVTEITKLGGDGGKDAKPPTLDDIARAVREGLVEELGRQDARAAWAKIEPSCRYYAALTRRLEGRTTLTSVEAKEIASEVDKNCGSNSSLMEGLLLLYDRERDDSDMSAVQHALPIYMLGVGVLLKFLFTRFRMIHEAARAEGMAEDEKRTMVRNEMQEIADVARSFERDVQRIAHYVRSFTVERILHDELAKGRFKLGSPALVARSDALIETYMGGADAPGRFCRYLQQVADGARSAAA